MRHIHDLSVISKRYWAGLHGYDFLDIRQWDEYPEVVWQKMSVIYRNIDHYDCIVWLDADAVITNQNITVHHLITEVNHLEEDTASNNNPCMFISKDWGSMSPEEYPYRFNTGNFVILKNNHNLNNLRKVFQLLWETGHKKWWNKWGFEQSTLEDIKRNNIIGNSIKILKGSVLNAVPHFAHHNTENPWEPSCFLAHLSGVSNDRRFQILNNELKDYVCIAG